MRTVLLLFASNAFMTVAWYGHLKFKGVPLWQAVLASWGIAFFEYAIQVPANRWGSEQFSVTQLKVMQEVVTLVVFTGFSLVVFREVPRWNHAVAFALVVAAVGFTFWPASAPPASP
jgi:uncharacterized protein (DUF486 family)